jgi:uncharacterized protein YbgA (DUF1722 family)/uncharacterized protein YbbK (DUF523 family)
MKGKIKLGISACLLGKKVRYDGGHKRNSYITKTLGKRFAWVPVCPEVEAGLSIPREPMQLTGDWECPRLVVITSGIDLTGVLNSWAGKKVKRLEREGLCGFILKSRSPSCAINDADLFTSSGKKKGKTAGLFSAMLMKHDSLLPIINEEVLAEPVLRDNFIERVYVYNRWHVFTKKKPSLGNLVSFHSDHKLQLMAHSPKHYSALGKLVAGAKGKPIKEVYRQYIAMLMEGLRLIATPKKNANVLMHIMGYFKKQLSVTQKQKLLKVIEQCRKEQVPLIVPINLLRHYVRKYDEQYLKKQSYLNPIPRH